MAPLYVSVQANFYRVPGAQLGDDPAAHLVTAGTAQLLYMPAGQTTVVLIDAVNALRERMLSGTFRALCHTRQPALGGPSFYCGDSPPFP